MAGTVHPGAALRERVARGVVAAPGAFCGLVARAVRRAGFEAAYFSGAATSAATGVPDVGLLTLDHFAARAREVVDGTRDDAGRPLPVIADADTGFGEAEMVRRTVVEYHRAGLAGLHIEDQSFPKRCGHLDGKQLLPADHMAEKIEWAVRAARDVSGAGGLVVCARTDARGVAGLDDAIARARVYAKAGADMIFPEGLADEAEFDRFAREMRALPRPPLLLANITEFGKSPLIPLARLGELGYHVVIYPVTTLRLAMGAVDRGLAELARTGTAAGLLDAMQTRADLYDLLGYTPGTPWQTPPA